MVCRLQGTPAYVAAQQKSWAEHFSVLLQSSHAVLTSNPAERLSLFKSAVRAAVREFLVSADKAEFARCVDEVVQRPFFKK
jgi:hypothetical protein